MWHMAFRCLSATWPDVAWWPDPVSSYCSLNPCSWMFLPYIVQILLSLRRRELIASRAYWLAISIPYAIVVNRQAAGRGANVWDTATRQAFTCDWFIIIINNRDVWIPKSGADGCQIGVTLSGVKKRFWQLRIEYECGSIEGLTLKCVRNQQRSFPCIGTSHLFQQKRQLSFNIEYIS